MYASGDQRAREIEDGARQPVGALRADLLAADGRLAEGFADLPDECWAATVRTARGREVPASQVPWMRVREVWVHAVDAVDLNIDTTFDDVPHEVCNALLDDVAAAFRAHPDCPLVELRAPDCAAAQAAAGFRMRGWFSSAHRTLFGGCPRRVSSWSVVPRYPPPPISRVGVSGVPRL